MASLRLISQHSSFRVPGLRRLHSPCSACQLSALESRRLGLQSKWRLRLLCPLVVVRRITRLGRWRYTSTLCALWACRWWRMGFTRRLGASLLRAFEEPVGKRLYLLWSFSRSQAPSPNVPSEELKQPIS